MIAADFGTSGVKVGLVDSEFSVIATRTASYPLRFPAPGFVEQDPADWWTAFIRAMGEIRADHPDAAARAAALVFCAQMCGVVCADENGEALRPCLTWLDKRSAGLTRRLVGGFPSLAGYNLPRFAQWIRLANGAPSHTGMDPPGKMMWVREHEPETWSRTHKLLDVKDWLLARATGRIVTTPDSANLTWMMDSRQGREGWSKRLADMVGVPIGMLPEIVDGASIVGPLTPRAAEELGLPADLPVVAGSGDVCSTAIGSGAVGDGELHIHMGTSSWTGGFFPDRRLSMTEAYATIAGAVDSRPLLIASQETAGACFDWLRTVLDDGNGTTIDDLIQAADEERQPPPHFLPWMTGERVPVDDSRLRGAFLGLSLDHGRSSMVKAVLEGVALNTRWAFRSVYRQRGVKTDAPIVVVGGAAMSEGWFRTLADCLQKPLVFVRQPQLVGVRGAAKIGASGIGWISSPFGADANRSPVDGISVEPDAARAQYFDDRFGEFQDAYRKLRPWFARVAGARAAGGGRD
jgi:xylulokinase